MPRLKLGEASQLHWKSIQGLGRGWGSIEKVGHDGRAWVEMAGGGACFSRRAPMISGSGEALGVQVPTAKASGGIYRRGHDTGARGRATTRGACAAVASPRSVGQAAIEHVAFCFCLSSSAHRLKIFANLGMITAQDLLPRQSFVVCVWKSSGLGQCIESCRVTRLSPEVKPCQGCVKRWREVSKLCHGVFKGIWHDFDIWTCLIWVLKNWEHDRSLERGWNSDFWISEFPLSALV
jgi:hypothetical protein